MHSPERIHSNAWLEKTGNSKANEITSVLMPVEAGLFVTGSILGIHQDT